MTIGLPRPWPGDPSCKGLNPLPVRRIRDFVIGFLQIPPRDGHPCLACLSQFEAISGYFDADLDGNPNRINRAFSDSVAVKTYPLS
jgi:hypothetical protein